MENPDVKFYVEKYKSLNTPYHRYSSFDYCYNYFYSIENLTYDIEKSCLTLGFYLASWGMLRGSSFLLQKSVKHFEATIQYIDSLSKSVWEIDVDKYDNTNISTIIEIYNKIKDRLITSYNADLTLMTKVLLGVFGFIPAFDTNFRSALSQITKWQCGFTKVNSKSLNYIKLFYDNNQTVIDDLANQTFTTDFQTGLKTNINYPKAKIIDMFGFTHG